MEIERLLKLETTVEDKIEMIISNNFDIMYKGKAAVTIDKWDKLRMEILAWHKSEVLKLNIDDVSISNGFTRHSNCCNEEVTVVGRVTKYSQCNYCKQSCDTEMLEDEKS